jgi:hypothetical protein
MNKEKVAESKRKCMNECLELSKIDECSAKRLFEKMLHAIDERLSLVVDERLSPVVKHSFVKCMFKDEFVIIWRTESGPCCMFLTFYDMFVILLESQCLHVLDESATCEVQFLNPFFLLQDC